jgi:hypothetical protein
MLLENLTIKLASRKQIKMTGDLCEHFDSEFCGCDRESDCPYKSDKILRVPNSTGRIRQTYLCESNGKEPFHLEEDGKEEREIPQIGRLKGIILTPAFTQHVQECIYTNSWAR